MLKLPQVESAIRRLCSLTTNVRLLYRPFVHLIAEALSGQMFINQPLPSDVKGQVGAILKPERVVKVIQEQTERSGWGKKLEQMQGAVPGSSSPIGRDYLD